MKPRRAGLIWTIMTLVVLSIGTLIVTTFASAAEYQMQEAQGLPIETGLGIYVGTWVAGILGVASFITAVVLLVRIIAAKRGATRS
jgi:carbon starvation protein CstA